MLTSTRLKICQQAIDHWMHNLLLCYAGEYDEVQYYSDDCAFCNRFFNKEYDKCLKCPLAQIGNCCENENSSWDKVVYALAGDDRDEMIGACANMLRAVERACDHLMSPKYKEQA